MALLSIGEILDLGNSANMSAYIPYSALDYDPTGAISGISGSAIAGGVDSSVVSSIVSSMVSSKADQSALEDCCSSMSSVVSSIQNDVSGISSYVSGLSGDYLEKSASSMFAPSGNYMSATESSSFYPMTGNPSGFLTGVDLSDYATTAYVDSSVSGKLDASASGQFQPSGYYQPSGDYAYNSSLSSYLYASSSSLFQPSGDYQTAGDYAYNSSVSAKLDASASSEFYLTSNPSGFITGVDLSNYATTAYVDSSVSGKMDKTESSSFYPMTGNPSGFLTSVDLSDYATTAYVDSSVSGKMDATASGYLQPSGDYAYNSSISSKLDASASSEFYLTSNPSGFITGVDLSNYATTAYVDSSVSSKLDSSASSSFYTVDNPSGFITGVDLDGYATTAYVDSSVSSKMDKSESSSFYPMTGNPSGFLTSVDLSPYQPTSAMTAYQQSGDYAYNSSLSSYINYSALSGSDNRITAISGSALGGVIPPTTQLILDDATMSGLIDPLTQDFYIGVKSGVFASDSGMTAYATKTYVDSSVSSKLDESAFTSYTATSIPIVIVGNSSEATAANVVYVVTGVPE